jgi:hypothetical protein
VPTQSEVVRTDSGKHQRPGLQSSYEQKRTKWLSLRQITQHSAVSAADCKSVGPCFSGGAAGQSGFEGRSC